MSLTLANVNVGTVANDGTGDSIRAAFVTTNGHFKTLENTINYGDYGVVYSATTIQANSNIYCLATTVTNQLNVATFANIAGNAHVANLLVDNSFITNHE